jgi:hypothetical protein
MIRHTTCRAVTTITLATALLAGCSQEPERRNEASGLNVSLNESARDEALNEEPESDEGTTSRPENLLEPTPAQSTDSQAPATTVPTAFRGTWSGSRSTCGKPGDDMALAISGDRLVFYESVGQVMTVKLLSPRSIRLTATYSGEGDTWMSSATLTVSTDGNTLRLDNAKRVRCSG